MSIADPEKVPPVIVILSAIYESTMEVVAVKGLVPLPKRMPVRMLAPVPPLVTPKIPLILVVAWPWDEVAKYVASCPSNLSAFKLVTTVLFRTVKGAPEL